MLRLLRHYAGTARSKLRGYIAARKILRGNPSRDAGVINRASWAESLKDPTAYYERCYRYFHKRLLLPLREHRRYFTEDRRGFGEDAFHTMWFGIFRELRPSSVLEIGVFRGQTLSLFRLLADINETPCTIVGISPFQGAGDSACVYPQNFDYIADVESHFRHFGLSPATLVKAYSTDPAAHEMIQSRQWDVMYIDGNHDYDVAKADWEICSANVRPGGLIVMDDAGGRTSFQPPCFSTKGFPGVSKLVSEIDPLRFPLVLQVGHNLVFERAPRPS